MVAVFATVRDREGRLVPNLGRDDFQVLDNGRPVRVDLFSNHTQPITAVLLLDVSGSMFDYASRVQESVLAFLETLEARDRIRLGTFGSEVAISPYLTNDKAILRRVLREEYWVGGSTPLWRAIDAGITSISAEAGRHVVLVLTDGTDSHNQPGDLPSLPGGIDELRRRAVSDRDLMVYAVGFAPAGAAAHAALSGGITDLAYITGGGAVTIPPGADLVAEFAEIADELRHQYAIGFRPLALDDKAHKVEVRMSRNGLKAKARTSYVADSGR